MVTKAKKMKMLFNKQGLLPNKLALLLLQSS